MSGKKTKNLCKYLHRLFGEAAGRIHQAVDLVAYDVIIRVMIGVPDGCAISSIIRFLRDAFLIVRAQWESYFETIKPPTVCIDGLFFYGVSSREYLAD